jgi:hypothetical protein
VTAVAGLLESAVRDLSDASAAPDPGERYVRAHMAALHAAAALVTVRGKDTLPRRARFRSVWELLASTVPEFAGQASVFAAAAHKREAAGAGLPGAVTGQETDVLLSEAKVLVEAAQAAAAGEPS